MKSFLEEMTKPAIQLSPVQKDQIPIDHDVPLPNLGRKSSDALRTVLKALQLGDSFVWKGCMTQPYAVAKEVGVHIYSQKTDQGNQRVWRIA